jgi:ribose 5-phosphate isomerase A
VNQNDKKMMAAEAAMAYVDDDMIVGVGTGSTVNFFIEKLAGIKHRLEGAVSSSLASEELLRKFNIPIISLNSVNELPIYVDGADEATKHLHLIKGGGGALTREKIVAAACKKFVCIADDTKLVNTLGRFPLPIEVIPMAQSLVARELVKLGGHPVLRDGFSTDNGNIILDVEGMEILNPVELEETLNNITGIVTNGLFARRPADVLILAQDTGISEIT